MFNKYTSIEKRYVLELINSIAQIDGSFSDEEGCILAAVAYLMEIDLDLWSPNLVDISLSYSRVSEMGKNKIKDVIILLMQVSIFDGVVKYEELATMLPLAYETNITDNEMLDLGRRAFSGEKFTTFDKLLVYALCVKMMEIDSVISESEKRTLSKIQERFNLPANFIDRQLVNNISWALNIMSAYSIKKRYKIIEYVTKVRDSDGVVTPREAKLLYKILERLGLKEYEQVDEVELINDRDIIDRYKKLIDEKTNWESWVEFVKEIFYEEYNHKLDNYLINAILNALNSGLTMEIDKYDYLEIKRILSNLYFSNKEFKELNKILKEVQNLEIIPKWYWSLISKLDFNQLSHGIQIKNEQLLNIVKEYRSYGNSGKVNLLKRYPKFLKEYKDYQITKHEQNLDFLEVTRIVGLVDNDTIKKEVSKPNEEVKYSGDILILGANKGHKKERMIKIAKENGFFGEIHFGPDYRELKRLGIEKYRNTKTYNCIFLAQSPHSAKGIGGKSSISKMMSSIDFPPTICLRTKTNKLYLTETSFKAAIIDAKQYLRVLK